MVLAGRSKLKSFQKLFSEGHLFVFVEYLCKRSPKIKTKNIKNYSSILAIVNHRNWLDDSPPLTRVCQVAWKLGKTPRDWQTGVIIPIFKKGDRKLCTNYREISLLSLPGKVYTKCLERKCREIVESRLEDGQSGFRPGRSITDQIFTLKQIFEKSWEYGKDLFACFVDLEKAHDRVPRDKLWKVLQEY